jgi:hypothetical protein
LLLLATSILAPATVVALVGAPAVGVVLVLALIAAYGSIGFNAHRFVVAIAEDHRDAAAAFVPTS